MGDYFVRCAFAKTNTPKSGVTDCGGFCTRCCVRNIDAQVIGRILVQATDWDDPPLGLATTLIQLPAGDGARLDIEATIPASIRNPLISNLLEALRWSTVFKCPVSNHFSVEATIHAVVDFLEEDAIHVFVDCSAGFVSLNFNR